MTPRSLFTIILKIMGISVLIDALIVIPQSVSSGIQAGYGYSSGSSMGILIAIGIILLTVAMYCFGIWVFLFRTDFIIDKLSLDKHFKEERFELNIHRSTILPVAIIVIGGMIIVHAMPNFCKTIFQFFQTNDKAYGQGIDNPNFVWIIYDMVELAIGYQLISRNRKIANWIELKRRKE